MFLLSSFWLTRIMQVMLTTMNVYKNSFPRSTIRKKKVFRLDFVSPTAAPRNKTPTPCPRTSHAVTGEVPRKKEESFQQSERQRRQKAADLKIEQGSGASEGQIGDDVGSGIGRVLNVCLFAGIMTEGVRRAISLGRESLQHSANYTLAKR